MYKSTFESSFRNKDNNKAKTNKNLKVSNETDNKYKGQT